MDREVKDFTYIDNGFNLHAHACRWLRDMGLKETRWILDREWFLNHYNGTVTYYDWIKDK